MTTYNNFEKREVGVLDGSDRSIDARSIVSLIVFFIVNILVIFPLRIPLPLLLSRFGQWVLVKSKLRRPALPDVEPEKSPANGNGGVHVDADAVEGSPAQQDDGSTPLEPPLNEKKDEAAKPKQTNTKGEVRRWYFTLGLETAPVIGVLLLLASTCIPGKVVRDGIVGSGGVRPYDIMTLFISFAYISLSLDSTGLLRYLAFIVASRSSSSGSLLYSAFYIFFAISGLLVGNDPLILSGTPFLAYFTGHASINPPTAYLFTHFQVSNLVSALLVSSNPTNLVLTSAFGISFLSYSAWLALPTVAAVIILWPLLRYWVFRGEGMIPRKLSPPKVDARAALKDPWGGIFGASLFLVTIVLLVGLSAGGKLEGVEGVWTITAPAALVMLTRDTIYDLKNKGKGNTQVGKDANLAKAVAEKRNGANEDPTEAAERNNPASREETGGNDSPEDASQDSPVIEKRTRTSLDEKAKSRPLTPTFDAAVSPADQNGVEASTTASTSTVVNDTHKAVPKDPDAVTEAPAEEGAVQAVPEEPSASAEDTTSSPVSSGASTPALVPRKQKQPRIPLFAPFVSTLPTVSSVISRLPLPLLPFAFSMFILVEALQHTGWIRVFGKWWTAWADVGGVAGSVWLMGTIGVLGCNVFGTNIGATILLSRVLQQWQFTDGPVSPRTLYGAVFALAVGSNFGAYSFVFSASLAGLLWRNILSQKNLHVSQMEFIRWNWLPLIVTMIVGCLVVAGEVCIMYKS